MTTYIENVKPRHWYQHYSQPESQGTLIKQTKNWPIPKYETIYCHSNEYWRGWHNKIEDKTEVPQGLKIDSAYTDRMYSWNSEKLRECEKILSNGLDSPDDELIRFVSEYFGVECVAVRTVFYFNVSSGYPCPRIDYLYKDIKFEEGVAAH